jgi:hypothetical protein
MVWARRPPRELGCARRKAAARDQTPIKPPTSADSELVEYPGPQRRFTGIRCSPAIVADKIELRQMVQSIPAKPTQPHVTNTLVWQSIKDAASRNMLCHNNW